MRTSRREFLGSLAAGAVAGPALDRKPNIVLILLDDLGYGDVGPYGQKMIRTPNIDRLAEQGKRFTDCYAGGAVCAPSRSALMTGFHTGHCSVRANAGTIPIPPEDVTVAEVLKSAGYKSGLFGKWGLGDAGSTGVPTKQGFDEYFGYLHQIHAHSYYPEYLWKNDRKFPLEGNRDQKRQQYSADLIAEQSFEFIRKHRSEPFFLYAAYTLPHGRHEVPSDAPYSGRDWPQGEKNYAAMITRADGYIETVLRLLGELGLDEKTVVFFSSDNGAVTGDGHDIRFFNSNGPLRGQKGQLYEGGIRVPMIVRWPGKIAPGAVSDLAWAFWDFLPTVAELAGAEAPRGLDGISVAPGLLGRPQRKHEFLYWEQHRFDQKTQKLREEAMVQAVRMGQWKAVRLRPGAPLELYNLREDIGESTNLAADHPEVIARIEAYLKTARTAPRPHDTGSFEIRGQATTFGPEAPPALVSHPA